MSKRSKEIAEKIIADVWATWEKSEYMRDIILPKIEAAVEKHIPEPHHVRDRDGDLWERMSNGRYRQLIAEGTYEQLIEWVGPLTTIQGEPLPDVTAMKARIAELEEDKMSMIETNARLRDLCDHQKVRIAELEKMNRHLKQEMVVKCDFIHHQNECLTELDERMAELKIVACIGATLGEAQPEPIWQLVSEDSWVYGVKVRGAVRDSKANVYFNGRDWVWYLNDSTVRGEADYFSKAIEAAEKAMGVK